MVKIRPINVHVFQFIQSSGLYCIIFVLYIRAHTSKKSRNLLVYPLSLLFALCTVYFIVDFVQQYLTIVSRHLL